MKTWRWRPGRGRILLFATSCALAGASGVAALTGSPAQADAGGLSVVAADTGITASQFAQSLVGNGVLVSNATFTGAPRAFGSFSGGQGVFGIDTGVAISTGSLDPTTADGCPNSIVGPASPDSTTANDLSNATCENDTPGDADLANLVDVSPDQTFDAAALSFDVVPASSTLSFDYVFGSEEYNEFVDSSFNDVFGLFVNGTNCALVPNAAAPVPVSINSVNLDSNSQYYVDNTPADFNGATPHATQLDGFTTVLTCQANVTPGQVNHVKLAISDVGDTAYDSVVMIRGGSFTSTTGTQPCTLTYAGDTQVASGSTTSVSADFGDPAQTGDLAGHSIQFTATPTTGDPSSVVASTDATGHAAASLQLPDGSYQVTAAFAGDAEFASCASTPSDLTVGAGGGGGPAATSLAIDVPDGGLSAQYSDPLHVTAHLTSLEAPVTGQPVTLAIGSTSQTVTTDANGVATADLPVETPAGPQTVTATFAGTPQLDPAGTEAPVDVTLEDCTLAYVGDTTGVDNQNTSLGARMAEPVGDTSPGSLTGKSIVFTLTNGDTQQSVTAPTDGTGLAQTSVPLAAGTWTVVPAFAGDSFYSPCAASGTTINVGTPPPPPPGPPALLPSAVHVDTAPVTVQYSDPFSVSISVTSGQFSGALRSARSGAVAAAAAALPGVPVHVQLGTAQAVVNTDAQGHAAVTMQVTDPSGPATLTVSYAGDATYAGSSASQVVQIAREQVGLSYVGAGSAHAGMPAGIRAALTDSDGSVGDLSGRAIAFAMTDGTRTLRLDAPTDSAGVARLGVDLPTGHWTVTPSFAGDAWYLPANGNAAHVNVTATSKPTPTPTPTPTQTPTPTPTHSRTPGRTHNVTPTPTQTSTSSSSSTQGTGSSSTDTSPGANPQPTGSPTTQVLGEKQVRPPLAPQPSTAPSSGSGGAGGATSAGEAQAQKPGESTGGQPKFVLGIPDAHQVRLASPVLLLNGLLALLMMMLITFPAELFNGTLKENYDEVRGWFGPIGRFFSKLESSPRIHSPVMRAFGGVVFVGMTGAIYGAVEPGYGLDRRSLQLVTALTIGLVIITVLANESALLFGRIRYHERGRLRMRPGALFVALGCVLLSRAAHFEPGYVYGLVAGFAFSRELPRDRDGRVVLAWASWLLVLATTGWLLLSPLKSWAGHHEASFWAPVAEELSAALVVESLTILILALVPLTFLEGERLFKWRKAVWAPVYLLAMFFFLHVVVHPDFAGRKTELPLYTWLSLFLGFALFSVSFWGFFKVRHARRRRAGELEPT